MTLVQTIKAIEYVALRQPSVNLVVRNDVFRINEKPDARYGIFSWTQGQHNTSSDSDYMNFTFTFFYVDRLTSNHSNEVEIQSTGIQTLNNILRSLEDYNVFTNTTYTFQTFNQRFTDECAGVFCNVTLSVPMDGICPEFFADFSDDFNEDYLIY